MNCMAHKTSLLFVFLSVILFIQPSYSQNYGLRFLGQNIPIQDSRTSLDLSPNAPLCFNGDFELSFKINFLINSKDYFGYIFRMIDDQSHNLDLMLYDQEGTRKKIFRIITGEKFSNISFELDSDKLFHQWTNIKLKFDKSHNNLTVIVNGKVYTQKNVIVAGAQCFKILFGANTYKKIRTTDLPDMRLKDIGITEGGKLTHLWPLNELNGNTATDEIQKTKAKVVNPMWVKSIHYNWEQVSSFSVAGNASVAFNPKTEQLFVTATDAMYIYSVPGALLQNTPYKSGHYVLLQGNQSIFDTISGQLYNLNIDRGKVASYNFTTQKWDNKFDENERITKFWHTNKLVSDIDHALYIFGGYGELKYKNLVQKYDPVTKQWLVLPRADSNAYGPRYLAALGVAAHTGNAYIIGGYGSLSGLQMLSPRNYYDLVKFNLKDKSFSVVYKFKYPENDFAFANSLIIDPKDNKFYGLIFPNQKFGSNLQLIKGSLTKPEYQLVGNKIPYQFYDVNSFADLYFCPISKKLVAVTLYRNNGNKTEVKIYTIGFPPNTLTIQQAQTKTAWLIFLVYTIVVMSIGIALYVILRKRKAASFVNNASVPVAPVPVIIEPVKYDTVNEIKAGYLVSNEEKETPLPQKSSIYLFGNLHVFDTEANNISRLFTPLLKELFLLILIFSIRRKTGVSSEKLNEILWFDKSKKDALNNRSVNIAKLKTILEKIGLCTLSKTTGYWKIEIDYNQIHVDYQQYLNIVDKKQALDKPGIESLFSLIQKGPLLLDTDYEWLDEFKAEVTNEIMDRLLLYAHSVDMTADPEMLIQTTNHIFHFDPVNEDAMQIQCKVLASLGKHSLSKRVYEKFVKDYKNIYNEDYNRSFHSIIE
jgi:two-component SAPR family response regulator